MARKRNYQEEYRRRILRGLSLGLTRSQARGHAPKRKKRSRHPLPKSDVAIDAAVLEINRGQSISAAARSSGVTPKRLRAFLTRRRLVKRKGRRLVPDDKRARRVPVITGGRLRVLTLYGYKQARLAGEHHMAVSQFVQTNNVELLRPFKGRSVRSIGGKTYPLEINPNALHRIAAMDTPPFHEIYDITSNT